MLVSSPSTVPAIATTRMAPFRPRQYVVITWVMYLLYGLAAACVVVGVVSLIGFLGLQAKLGADAARDETGAAAKTRALVSEIAEGGLISMAVVSLIFWCILATVLVGCAEAIRIVLDIQANTQETAYYTRLGKH